jgi:hypothetical protein
VCSVVQPTKDTRRNAAMNPKKYEIIKVNIACKLGINYCNVCISTEVSVTQ